MTLQEDALARIGEVLGSNPSPYVRTLITDAQNRYRRGEYRKVLEGLSPAAIERTNQLDR